MNIFYDDLFCKKNTDDINFFKQKGFVIEDIHKIKKMTINEVYNNLYSYLDDYKNHGFKFVNFPDELVIFSKNNEVFYCFGKSLTGYFLINNNENIYILNNEYTSENLCYEFCFVQDNVGNLNKDMFNKYIDFFKDGVFLQYVNKSLLDFVNTYNYFLASIHTIKGSFKAYNQSLSLVSDNEANSLQEKLSNIDNDIISVYSYWGNMIEEIRGVNVALNFQLAPYILTGRL